MQIAAVSSASSLCAFTSLRLENLWDSCLCNGRALCFAFPWGRDTQVYGLAGLVDVGAPIVVGECCYAAMPGKTFDNLKRGIT